MSYIYIIKLLSLLKLSFLIIQKYNIDPTKINKQIKLTNIYILQVLFIYIYIIKYFIIK